MRCARPPNREKVERKPCAVRSPRPIRRSSISNTMLDIGSARRGPGNTGAAGSGLPSRISANGRTVRAPRARHRTAARDARGPPSCARPARSKPSASRSISPHRAPNTSPVRAAVRIANSSARAAMPSRPRRCGEEFGHLVEGQRGMVLDLPHLAAGRQDMGEIAFPLRRVRPLPEAAHRRGVEHRLDAAAHPARGFGLLGPDRIEHLHDKPGIDRRDGQFPQSRVNVGGERRRPLLPRASRCASPPGSFR